MRVKASQLRLLTLFVALILLCGCAARKSAKAPMPPQGAPVATPEPTPSPSPAPSPTPEQNQAAQQSQLPGQGTPPPEPAQTPVVAQKEKKSKSAKQHSASKKSASHSTGTRETAEAKTPKALPAPEPEMTPANGQISPGGAANVARGDPTTEQLLQKTENNLNNLKRQLSPDEQTVVTQIRDFMNQSRQASKENDASRAHNFALKASLLCDDLINKR